MSVAYTTTSFGTSHPSHSAHPFPSSAQRQSSSSSRSSDTFATAASGLPLPVTASRPPEESPSLMRVQYDQIGAFFGARPERGAYNPGRARGSDRASTNTNTNTMNTTSAAVPPSYDGHTEVESLPTYSKVEEYDAKFNRKLFIYGFLFFPLWIVGIIAPFVKPIHDPARDNRTKEDQEADYANMHKVEMRWAWRCAAALLGLVLVVVVAVVVGVTVANNH